mmetsp:Transcript_1180/g.3444  ORF Transcript_1180/g.3444 Transcript_1180/m.3444 type:complete len:444 (-) Transcript_1180:82-1413(-)
MHRYMMKKERHPLRLRHGNTVLAENAHEPNHQLEFAEPVAQAHPVAESEGAVLQYPHALVVVGHVDVQWVVDLLHLRQARGHLPTLRNEVAFNLHVLDDLPKEGVDGGDRAHDLADETAALAILARLHLLVGQGSRPVVDRGHLLLKLFPDSRLGIEEVQQGLDRRLRGVMAGELDREGEVQQFFIGHRLTALPLIHDKRQHVAGVAVSRGMLLVDDSLILREKGLPRAHRPAILQEWQVEGHGHLKSTCPLGEGRHQAAKANGGTKKNLLCNVESVRLDHHRGVERPRLAHLRPTLQVLVREALDGRQIPRQRCIGEGRSGDNALELVPGAVDSGHRSFAQQVQPMRWPADIGHLQDDLSVVACEVHARLVEHDRLEDGPVPLLAVLHELARVGLVRARLSEHGQAQPSRWRASQPPSPQQRSHHQRGGPSEQCQFGRALLR